MNAQKQAIEQIRPGEVLVIDARGERSRAPSATSSPCGRSAAARPAS